MLCISLCSKVFWLPSAFSVYLIFKLSGRLALEIGAELVSSWCLIAGDVEKTNLSPAATWALLAVRKSWTVNWCLWNSWGTWGILVCFGNSWMLMSQTAELCSSVWLAVHRCLQLSSFSESWLFSKEIKNISWSECWGLSSWWRCHLKIAESIRQIMLTPPNYCIVTVITMDTVLCV